MCLRTGALVKEVRPSDGVLVYEETESGSLREAAADKTRAVTSATADVMRDAFDKVICVHVLYFWKDLDISLREIARVLKPGVRLGLLFRSKADLASVASFPPEIYRFPALADVTEAVERVGLDVHAGTDYANEPVLLLAEKRPARTASEASHTPDQADAIQARRAIT